MGAHAAPRLEDFSYRGPYEYSLTICTYSQQQCFLDATTVERVRTHLLRISSEETFDVTAYCFMPDHVHVLVTGTSEESDLRRYVSRWEQATGYQYKGMTGGRLWQPGFYDHILRQEEDRRTVIRYLLNNPIRAGLVASLNDYPYWGSGLWTREQLIEEILNTS
jgi:putative transposase